MFTKKEQEEIKSIVLSVAAKLSGLPESANLEGTDLIGVVEDGVSKKMLFSVFAQLLKEKYPEVNGARFMGVATPSTVLPQSTTTSIFYIAILSGTYTNFNGLTVGKIPCVFYYDIQTQIWTRTELWGEVNGIINFPFRQSKVGNSIESPNLPVMTGEEYEVELDIHPTGCADRVYAKEYNKGGTMLQTFECHNTRFRYTPGAGVASFVVVIEYHSDNPASPEATHIIVKSSISSLVERTYEYCEEMTQRLQIEPVILSQTEYEELEVKDPDTIYMVYEDEEEEEEAAEV